MVLQIQEAAAKHLQFVLVLVGDFVALLHQHLIVSTQDFDGHAHGLKPLAQIQNRPARLIVFKQARLGGGRKRYEKQAPKDCKCPRLHHL